MAQYEQDMADLKAKASQIPKEDIITRADENRAINDHFDQENLLEKSLGRKYLTKIEP